MRKVVRQFPDGPKTLNRERRDVVGSGLSSEAYERELPSLEGRGWGWVGLRRVLLFLESNPPPAPPFQGGEENGAAPTHIKTAV